MLRMYLNGLLHRTLKFKVWILKLASVVCDISSHLCAHAHALTHDLLYIEEVMVKQIPCTSLCDTWRCTFTEHRQIIYIHNVQLNAECGHHGCYWWQIELVLKTRIKQKDAR
jgi:hypothetical protein